MLHRRDAMIRVGQAGLGALAAVLSMFRKPLAYYARRWSGRAGDVSE